MFDTPHWQLSESYQLLQSISWHIEWSIFRNDRSYTRENFRTNGYRVTRKIIVVHCVIPQASTVPVLRAASTFLEAPFTHIVQAMQDRTKSHGFAGRVFWQNIPTNTVGLQDIYDITLCGADKRSRTRTRKANAKVTFAMLKSGTSWSPISSYNSNVQYRVNRSHDHTWMLDNVHRFLEDQGNWSI